MFKMENLHLAYAVKRLGDAMETDNWRLAAHVLSICPSVVHYIGENKTGRSSPLFFAASRGNIPICSLLLKYHADVDFGHEEYGSPLLVASYYGYPHVCTLLLRHGANVNYKNKDGGSPMWLSVQNGHADVVEILIKYGANINQIFRSNNLLQCAIHTGRLEIVNILIQNGADVNRNHPLLLALELGFFDICKVLLEKADVNSFDDKGMSPLLRLVTNPKTYNTAEEVEVMEMLIEKGADVNLGNDIGSPLLFAVNSGRLEACKILVISGADVNYKENWKGSSCLRSAIFGGFNDICLYLLEKGADVNYVQTSDGGTALLLASEQGKYDMCSILLQYGADVNYVRFNPKTGGTFTALLSAISFNHGDVVSILLWHGADVNHVINVNGFSLTPLLCGILMGHHDIVTNLLHHEADVHHKVFSQLPILFFAVIMSDAKMCQILLEFEANPQCSFDADDEMNKMLENGMEIPMAMLPSAFKNFEDLNNYKISEKLVKKERNNGILLAAIFKGDPDKCDVLLNYRADFEDADTYGMTPLMEAAKDGHADVIKCLLSHGANVNKKDVKGFTALYHAVQSGRYDAIKVLLEYGADPNVENVEGSTVLDDSAFSGDTEIMEILLKHGAKMNTKALYKACTEGNLRVVELLIDKGASVDEFRDGAAPIHLAAQYNRTEVIRYLVEEAGCDVDIVSIYMYTLHFLRNACLLSERKRRRRKDSTDDSSFDRSKRICMLSSECWCQCKYPISELYCSSMCHFFKRFGDNRHLV